MMKLSFDFATKYFLFFLADFYYHLVLSAIMIGQQQTCTGITGLKSTLQPPNFEEAASATQEGQDEIAVPNVEIVAPTKTEIPASNGDGAANNDLFAAEDPEAKPDEDGGDEPIDMSFPVNDGWKKILLYLISFPIMAPLYVTLPDTKDKISNTYRAEASCFLIDLTTVQCCTLQKESSSLSLFSEASFGSPSTPTLWFGGRPLRATQSEFLRQ